MFASRFRLHSPSLICNLWFSFPPTFTAKAACMTRACAGLSTFEGLLSKQWVQVKAFTLDGVPPSLWVEWDGGHFHSDSVVHRWCHRWELPATSWGEDVVWQLLSHGWPLSLQDGKTQLRCNFSEARHKPMYNKTVTCYGVSLNKGFKGPAY